jgi:predicted acetyltransferase
MGNLVIREYEPKDDAGFRHVRAMVYRNGEAVKPEDRILADDCVGYVGDLDGEIICAATAIDMDVTVQGDRLRCGGIAAVGVLPERRRGGFGGELMSRTSPLMREKGFALAALYPFRSAFYAKYGYAHSGHRLAIVCPADRLPKVNVEVEPRLLPNKERDAIIPCYEQFARRYNGMALRKQEQWDRVLGVEAPRTIYVVGDPIEAYAVVKISSDFWVNQPIQEFVWNSGRGYRALLSLFRGLSMNKNAVEWREPGDSPYHAFHMEQGADLALDRGIMYRILDVPKALSTIRRDLAGEFCFRVIDRDVPENNGDWHVCFSPDGTRVEKGKDPDFEISVARLTQALMGDPSLESIFAQGEAQVFRVENCATATVFFQPANALCLDFF